MVTIEKIKDLKYKISVSITTNNIIDPIIPIFDKLLKNSKDELKTL